jgi:hypothetical protein
VGLYGREYDCGNLPECMMRRLAAQPHVFNQIRQNVLRYYYYRTVRSIAGNINRGGLTMKKLFVVALGLVIMMLASGCTRSLDVAFQSDTARLSNAAELEKVTIGVAKFEDKRAWVEAGDMKSESYVALQSPWKFGLTYKETDYMPVKDIVQDLLVQELTKAGFKAKALDVVLTKTSLQSLKNINKDPAYDYVLGGQLLIFEFVNETGMWTVTSRRSVTINLILFNGKNSDVLIDMVLTETDREGEGMGVMHSTNADKLMNGVFKKVTQQIIKIASEKIAPP